MDDLSYCMTIQGRIAARLILFARAARGQTTPWSSSSYWRLVVDARIIKPYRTRRLASIQMKCRQRRRRCRT